MRAPIPLLLAVLAAAAALRFGGAAADPLPAPVVELVKAGSLSSLQDLHFFFFSDSIEVETETNPPGDNDTINRLPRSLLDAQPAQQAVCKVRTEVIEVTRSMLDRSNANFLLWPPCVEVQRCSGCCNTKSLQCVPVLTHTRHLQVMKIQYLNKRPLYEKAVVSVLDHVECRCQAVPRPAPRPAPRRKSGMGKQEVRSRSKDELHRRDELKHNQRLSLEELLGRSWTPKESEVKLHYNHTLYAGVKGHQPIPEAANDTSADLPNHTEREQITPYNETTSQEVKQPTNHSDCAPPTATQAANQNGGEAFLDGGTSIQPRDEEVDKPLPLDDNEESTNHQSSSQQQTSTQATGAASSPPQRPHPPLPHLPPRASSPQRRRRKQRHRISKSALRALLM